MHLKDLTIKKTHTHKLLRQFINNSIKFVLMWSFSRTKAASLHCIVGGILYYWLGSHAVSKEMLFNDN